MSLDTTTIFSFVSLQDLLPFLVVVATTQPHSLQENLNRHMTADDKQGHLKMVNAVFNSLHNASHALWR